MGEGYRPRERGATLHAGASGAERDTRPLVSSLPVRLRISAIDWPLVVPLLLLAAFGCVGLASLALRSDPPNYAALTRQLIAFGIAAVAFVIAARLDWRAWERGWPLVAVVTGLLLLGVLLAGRNIRGVRGWFAIGSLTLQPVELAKIGLILLQAVYFRRRARVLVHLRTVLESAGITALVVLPVLLQPDLGSALILIATWLGMLVVFGLRRAHLLAIVGAALVLVVVGWTSLLQPYQRERIRTFLDPQRDPQGAGYNQRQATIAVGAGGVWGRGFGQGTQSQLRFLPEASSDFLPAVIAEEFGFVGLTALIACVGAILVRLAAVARRCTDDAAAAIVVGVGFAFGVQALANLAVNLGAIPVIGIPFPFVSVGGSAALAFGLAFGIVANIARGTPRAEPAAYAADVVLRG